MQHPKYADCCYFLQQISDPVALVIFSSVAFSFSASSQGDWQAGVAQPRTNANSHVAIKMPLTGELRIRCRMGAGISAENARLKLNSGARSGRLPDAQ